MFKVVSLFMVVLFAFFAYGHSAASLTLELLAEPAATQNLSVVFGDTDHDGLGEVIFETRNHSTCCPIVFYEATSQGGYVLTNSVDAGIPYATGDLDQDGKSELISSGSGQLEIHEASDANSHPSTIVWQAEVAWTNLYLHVADTDRDGNQEMLLTSGSDFIIFENAGDNSYVEVYRNTLAASSHGEKVIADFDGDGLIEVAFGNKDGTFVAYESPSDNVWNRVWASTDPGQPMMPMSSTIRAKGGVDTDGNGLPEIFVAGGRATELHTLILESDADNSFAIVSSLIAEDATQGSGFNALGNLDGVGALEYVLELYDMIYVFRAHSPGVWAEVASFRNSDLNPDGSGGNGIAAGDINGNGRDELVWMRGWLYDEPTAHTMILESPYVSTAAPLTPSAMTLSVLPNPATSSTMIRLRGRSTAYATVTVHDARGRIVRVLDAGPLMDGSRQLQWDGADSRGVPVASGVYRIIVSAGQEQVSKNVTIAR